MFTKSLGKSTLTRDATPCLGGDFSLKNNPQSSKINVKVDVLATAVKCEDMLKLPIVITDLSGICNGLKQKKNVLMYFLLHSQQNASPVIYCTIP